MKHLHSIEIDTESNEEILPGFSTDFPYIATCAELDTYVDPFTPWHWHRPVELFYIHSGCLEYQTPMGRWVFPAGSGGFVNSNVLHTSSFQQRQKPNIQLLHLFDPSLIAGEPGSLIEKKYVLPLTADSSVEMLSLFPEDPKQATILKKIQSAFSLDSQQWGYELRMREILSDIWLDLFDLVRSDGNKGRSTESDGKIKKLMIYIHEHYQHPISVDELAKIIPVSRRACFRLFQDNLHMTPAEYIRSYRLQKACHLLTQTNTPVTQIAGLCGFGTSSHFGKLFRDTYGCTPSEYRKQWHDCDNFGRESYIDGAKFPL